MKLLISPYHDPFVNLALENYFFRLWEKYDKDQDDNTTPENLLFLYTNEPSVIMGRFQNPWKELNWASVRMRRQTVVRRQSGGGTVYHDLGNLNFSFITGEREIKKESNLDKIRSFFKRNWGISISRSPMFDLHVRNKDGQYKVSGNAFKQGRVSSIHHGTLLINASLSHLGDVLDGIPVQIETKAVDSRPQKVTNLSELYPGLKVEDCLEKFQEEHDLADYNLADILELEETQIYIEKLKSQKWLFDETPHFKVFDEFNFDWGKVKVKLDIKKSSIVLAHLSSNIVKTDWSQWERKLEGHKLYDRKSYRELVDFSKHVEDEQLREFLSVFLGWMRMTWSL